MELKEVKSLLKLNKEILSWLSIQKGFIPKDYARDLARQLVRAENEVQELNEPKA